MILALMPSYLCQKWTTGNFLEWTASIACSTFCPGQSLSTSYSPSNHDPSDSPAPVSFAPHPFFLPLLLEHLYVVVSEMDHDNPVDLVEVKLCWRVWIHLTFSALQISGSFSNFRQELQNDKNCHISFEGTCNTFL